MHVVFTTTPQEFMNTVRRKYRDILGYHDTSAQADRMAEMTKLIQAWYLTATVDLRGNVEVDTRHGGGVELCMPNPVPMPGLPCIPMYMPRARVANVTGSRLGDGLSSAFVHVLVVANPDKLVTYEMGALGDYIAMLALSQPGPLESCAEFPTILNLLAPDCNRLATALTDGDVAYLKALYKMTPANTLSAQRGEMRYQMIQALK